MKLAVATAIQIMLCVLSFYFLVIFGAWAESLPWRLVFPIAIGFLWLLVTIAILRRVRSKLPFVLIAVLEFPFAFGWPAWLFLYVASGH